MRRDSTSKYQEIVNLKRWNQIVRAMFGYKSFLSGLTEKTDRLNAHHIIARANSPHLAYDPNNGIQITETEHKAFHDEYGIADRTGELFEKWATKHYSITEFLWKRADAEARVVEAIQKLEDDLCPVDI